jgi:hypothetical protein
MVPACAPPSRPRGRAEERIWLDLIGALANKGTSLLVCGTLQERCCGRRESKEVNFVFLYSIGPAHKADGLR